MTINSSPATDLIATETIPIPMEPLTFAIGDKKPVLHEIAIIAPGVAVTSVNEQSMQVYENRRLSR